MEKYNPSLFFIKKYLIKKQKIKKAIIIALHHKIVSSKRINAIPQNVIIKGRENDMKKNIEEKIREFVEKYDGNIELLKKDFQNQKISGSSRDVYLVDEEFVAKVQNGQDISFKQNVKEISVWKQATKKERKYLAKIYDTCCGEDVIIMQRADQISNENEIEYRDETVDLVIHHKLSLKDAFKTASWGKVSKNSHAVLIDYGCDDETLADLEMDNTYKDEDDELEEDVFGEEDGYEITSFDERKHSL